MHTAAIILSASLAITAQAQANHPGDGGAEHCPQLSPRTSGPSGIDDIRFDEVDVIMSMGDSITACTGCSWDQVWSHGGRNDTDTLASLMSHFNADLYGAATGSGAGQKGLNFAVPGAVASSLPGQASKVLDTLRSDANVDFENDWKLLTWWIGGNNVCRACNGDTQHTPEEYKKSLMETLDILSNVPRLRVNILTQPVYSSLYYLTRDLTRCFVNRSVCPCLMQSEESAMEVDALAREYSRVSHEVAEEWHNPAADFAVTVQSFGDESEVIGVDYLWPVDCFHFGPALHARMGHTTFNSLSKPAADKPAAIDYFTPLVDCPTENDRLM